MACLTSHREAQTKYDAKLPFPFFFLSNPINHWFTMSNDNDLYSKFAIVVDGFGPDSAKETADHFADLTCLHEK